MMKTIDPRDVEMSAARVRLCEAKVSEAQAWLKNALLELSLARCPFEIGDWLWAPARNLGPREVGAELKSIELNEDCPSLVYFVFKMPGPGLPMRLGTDAGDGFRLVEKEEA